MYYMNTANHRRQHFSRLRMNEKNYIRSYTGTTWLAYDGDQQPLLLNNNYNLFLLDRHSKENNFEIVVTSTKK